MIKGSSEEPDLEGSGVAEEDLQCKDPCLEIHALASIVMVQSIHEGCCKAALLLLPV